MNMPKYRYYLSLLILLLTAPIHADDLLTVRSTQSFPEAMLTVQSSIKKLGYQIARVQRIDIGLTGKGYKTDKYRVVFVGKPYEIHYLIKKYPVLVPYMPPQISVFGEHGETMMVTANPKIYADMIDDKQDKILFERWEKDIYALFDDVRAANKENF